MRISEGVEWAAHCVVFLAALPEGGALPAERLAEQHGVPRPYLAKVLQNLSAAGLIASRQGRRGGYYLTRAPEDITLLEVVLAIEGDSPAFACTEIRKRGPNKVAARLYPPRCGIAAAMDRAEEAWRRELESTTVRDIATVVTDTAPKLALDRTAAWLETVVN